MDKKIELYKNIKYNLAFDKIVKPSNFFQEKSNSYRSRSNRKIDFKFNSQIEKIMSEGNRYIEKENNSNKDINMITNIELNQFKPKFCYKKQREYIEKILLEEAMKIILVKLDIQNLFKKIYKDVPDIEEQNSEYESIEMSNACKKDLSRILSK
jgi:hypothetical protein